jgi:hypothetical protein
MLGALWAPALHANYIWNTNMGSAVSFSPTTGLAPEPLSFTLPYEGNPYTSLTISPAGFVWIGSTNTSQCCIPNDESDFLDDFEGGPARIAPLWLDVNTASGSVYFNQTSDGTTSDAIITFLDVAPLYGSPSSSDLASYQMQLFSNGDILFSYMTFDPNSLGTDAGGLIGLTSAGNFSPTAADLSSVFGGGTLSINSTSIYDYLPVTGSFDFSGQSILFTPTSANSFTVSNGVPEPATLFPTGVCCCLLAAFLLRQRHARKY